MPRPRATPCELVARCARYRDRPRHDRRLGGVTGPDHAELPERRRLLELDEALLVQLEQAEEVHHDLHAGARPQPSAPGSWSASSPAGETLSASTTSATVTSSTRTWSTSTWETGRGSSARRAAARTSSGRQEREQVRLQALEALVQPGEARPGLRRGQLGGREPDAGGGERRALDKAGEQVVTLLEEGEVLLVGLVASGKEPPALQLDEGGGDDQEFGGDLEVEPLHRLDLGQEGVHDVGERDLVQVDPLLGDEPQQQVERPCEDVGADLVCHEAEVTGRMPRLSDPRLRCTGVLGLARRARYPSAMERVFSGVQSSGAPHVGNYFGAFRQWVADQYTADSFFCVVDLHALTAEHDPTQLRSRTLETASWLFAAGLDPDICTVFVQSHVPEHTELSWLLECTATDRRAASDDPVQGEGRRQRVGHASGCSPTRSCMAADILLYDTDKVPVGDDQRQHLELTRDVAIRFNNRYGDTFVVPEADVPKVARQGDGPPAPGAQDVEVGRRRRSGRST